MLGLLAAAVALGFALLTGHIWEDYYITFRASQNLANGNGLVFQPGERIHSFTSPLGTLLPAAFALGDGEGAATRALWIFRLVSGLALGAAVALAAGAMQRAGTAAFALGAVALAWLLDPKTVDFAINGMESALVVLFVVVTWRALAEGRSVAALAAGVAGLQWTRPDGVVFFAALAAAWWLLATRGRAERISGTRTLLTAGALAFLLYLPWLAFTWFYYGSPLPHTMQAKIPHHPPGELAVALLLYPWRLLFGSTALHDLFLPAYWFFGGWPEGLRWISRLLAVGAALTWLAPGVARAGRIASLAFLLGGWYVEYLPRSPWYYPGWQALGFIAWAHLLGAAWQQTRWRGAIRIAGGTLVAFQAMLLLAVAVQMRTQQRLIEDGLRTPIGRWLREQAQPGDRVYLEPLGYIGYFSGLKMLDFPGLASSEVVAARRSVGNSHAALIATLTPEWLVLRPDQVSGILAETPSLLHEQYHLARTCDARTEVAAVNFLPGRGYLQFDAVYHVFRRRAR